MQDFVDHDNTGNMVGAQSNNDLSGFKDAEPGSHDDTHIEKYTAAEQKMRPDGVAVGGEEDVQQMYDRVMGTNSGAAADMTASATGTMANHDLLANAQRSESDAGVMAELGTLIHNPTIN